jgi:catechol 2,3-dioxygenase-like lactoylglutathione lyase family enzyme
MDTRQASLAAQFVRLGYVAINVSDLERSRAFYEAVPRLRVVARTSAPTQAFNLLGVPEGRFDGYLMDDASGGDPTCIHLIEWKEPAPRGRPNPTFYHAGWGKIAFTHNSAKDVLAHLQKHGTSTANKTIVRDYVSITDPDGVVISFLHNPSRPASQLFHVVSGPSDPLRTVAFYQELFGLEYWMKSQPAEPIPASQGPGADIVQWDSHILRGWGDHRFNIDVSKILHPPQAGRPCEDPLNLGIARIGIEVRDIEATVALLKTQLDAWSHTEARLISPIEEWDLGPQAPKRKVAALIDPDGMRIDVYQPERNFFAQIPSA